MSDDLGKILNGFPDKIEVEFLNNAFKGIVVKWCKKDVGFGELSFGWLDGKFVSDTESMSPEFVSELLHEAVPHIVDKIFKDDEGE